MWWLAPAALAVGAVALIDVICSDEERRARQDLEEARRHARGQQARNSARLEGLLRKKKLHATFQELANQHFESHRTADLVYQTLAASREEIDKQITYLAELKACRDELVQQRNAAWERRDHRSVQDAKSKLAAVRELLAGLRDDIKRLKSENREILAEVRLLNQQTRALKERIGRECGERGAQWYAERERAKAHRVRSQR